MDPELRSLHALREAITLGSISKAAERLRIAQPHVSRLILALEREFGAALLERHAKGVRATEAGELLAALGERIANDIAATRARVAAADSAFAGTVTLGLPTSLAMPLLPALVAAARREYPAVRLRLIDGFSARLHDMMMRGQLDLALLYADPAGKSFAQQPLLAEPLGLVGLGGPHQQGSVAITALAPRALILPTTPNRLRLLVDAAAAAAGVALQVVEEVDSFPVLVDLVERGFGETILPFSALAPLALGAGLSWRPLSPAVERKIVMARARDRVATPAMRALSTLIHAQAAGLALEKRWRILPLSDGL